MAKKPISLKNCSTSNVKSAVSYGKSVTAKRAQRLYAKRNNNSKYKPSHFRSKTSNYYGSSVDECESSSGQAAMTDARLQHAYYSLIVKSHYGDWRYVVPYDHGLSLSHTPIMFAASSIDKLTALWERVVMHNGIPWSDSVMPQTLKIIAYSIDVEEVTEAVFGEDYEHKRKTAALMMMDDRDARRLGLAEEKAKQVLFHNPEYEDEDEHLLRQLAKESTSHTLDNILVLD